MTDWNHISSEDMEKSQENSKSENRFMLELHEENFISSKELFTKSKFAEEKIYGMTSPSYAGDLIIPSIYIEDNKFIVCNRSMAVPGIMLTVISFGDNIVFSLELYNNFYIKKYHFTKSKFYPFLVIDRSSVKNFTFEDHHKFRAVKPKTTHMVVKKLFDGIPIGGLVPLFLFNNITRIAANAEADAIEKVGTIFNLSYEKDGKLNEIAISCETHYADIFERFLKVNWTKELPMEDPEPTTKEEVRKRRFEMTNVGDKVRFPGWNMKYGHVVKKESEYAVIKLITKDGSEKFENVDYYIITRLRE